MSTLAVNDVTLGIEQRGEKGSSWGKLILLHGFTGSAHSWGRLLDQLAATGLYVVALDMLGHGESDAPTDPTRYSMEWCQKDIIAALTQLGIKPGEAVLLGYSMGGRIALYCAFSRFFHALILESASAGLADPEARIQRQHSDEALATQIEHEGIEHFVNYWEQLPLFASQRMLPMERQQAQHLQRLTNRTQGLANSLRGVGTGVQPALYDHLSALNLPVLLLAGELDSKFSQIAQELANRLPAAQVQLIPDAGHTVHLERPDLFIQYVHTFCTTVLR